MNNVPEERKITGITLVEYEFNSTGNYQYKNFYPKNLSSDQEEINCIKECLNYLSARPQKEIIFWNTGDYGISHMELRYEKLTGESIKNLYTRQSVSTARAF
jgi:hypothetical protein